MCVTRSYSEPDTLITNFRINKKCPEIFSLEQKQYERFTGRTLAIMYNLGK